MKKHFTIKLLLITLLVMISCTMKAEIVEYTTDDGFFYGLDTDTQEASLAQYSGDATEIVIPESVTYEGKDYKVTSLGWNCFRGCSSLTSIEIPSSVTSLGDRCFHYCPSLTSVEIPSSVTSLGEGCFSSCYSLTSIEIPSSVTSLGEGCFSDCSSLMSIEIPSSVTSLGDRCFEYCSALTSIEIPSSVTNLGNYCFADCPSLESIVVDANNPKYDSREGCNAIIETESNTMITGCKNTRIPSSMTSLGEGCFAGCESLTSIDIPSSVTSLGGWCFSCCSALTSIYIPSSVTSLGDYCFYGCSALTSIDIPSSVTSLGEGCFYYCPSLKTVICKMESVIEDGSLFWVTPIADATLYVPEEMLDTYKSTDPWSGFGTILPWTEELEVNVDYTPELDIAINTNNGNVVVSGLADGTLVSCYTVDGRMLGKASADGGTATFTAEPNSVVIVKAGKKSFKVYVK